jgi:predicted nucleic acid-binding protein
MKRILVADTGPLIALSLVKLLPVLPKLFALVYVTKEVVKEATIESSRPGCQAICKALETGLLTVRGVEMTSVFQDFIDFLDGGEAETLALAKELNAVALIDERRGRKAAINYGIAITGSAAILIKAKQKGFVGHIRPYIEKLHQQGYRMSDQLIADVLKRVNE